MKTMILIVLAFLIQITSSKKYIKFHSRGMTNKCDYGNSQYVFYFVAEYEGVKSFKLFLKEPSYAYAMCSVGYPSTVTCSINVKTFPLKYIIDKDSYNRLNKEMKSIEDNVNIEKKLFPKNYFIKNNWENSKKNFDISLKNEINSKHINLIEYLNKDKNISNIFIQKFCNLNKEEINKLDAISKKLLYKKKQDIQFNENIKNKIKANIMNININFRQSLNNMNNKLNKYELILNKGKDKNIFNDKNDKNRYLEQFMDAEKNWDKYNLERLYKKSSSPRRSLFRPLQE